MLSHDFQAVYDIFKQKFYESLCANHELTMQEAFSLDIIYMLKKPTILEFANYMNISQPNATYKINQLIEKGYLIKTVCNEDKRAYRLDVTEKFMTCYRENDRYIKTILTDIENIFDEHDVQRLKSMLNTIYERIR